MGTMDSREKLIKALRENDNVEVAKIIDATASEEVNRSDASGTTGLHIACGATNNHEAVKKLLNVTDAPVNAKGQGGFTPVMVAAGYCSVECVKLLLNDPRVDLDLEDRRGQKLEDLVAIAGGCKASSRQKQQVITCIREERQRRELQLTEQNLQHLNLAAAPRPSAPPLTSACRSSTPASEGGEVRKRNSEKADGDEEAADGDKGLHKNLECPICLEVMRPPLRIWMCSSTHVICEHCKNKLENQMCPTCRSSQVSIRAFFAENMARSLFDQKEK